MGELTPYSCAEAFSRLDDFLDRELSADEMRLVKELLDTCQMCAMEFKFEGEVLQQVRAKLAHIDLPEELLRRVATALDEAESSKN